MINFTVEEALANLKDPLHPMYIKKDVEENSDSEAGSGFSGGGIDSSTNLANGFTKESWKEFCDKYELRYFTSYEDVGDLYDVYVNFETCVIIVFDSEEMEIDDVYWNDSNGELQYESLCGGTLEPIYEAMMHAMFPKQASKLFTYLVHLDYSEKFFPARQEDSTIWELLEEKIRYLETEENAEFIDKVSRLILVKVDDDAKASSSVDVDRGEFVFRQNVHGDGSYSEDLLEVEEVKKTYVELLVHDQGLGNHSIYTYRSDFWDNFGRIADLESEVIVFLLELFDNVLNEEIIEAVVQQKKFEGEPAFTRYAASDEHAEICTPHFELCCFAMFSRDLTIRFIFRDLREGFVKDEKEQTFAEGFYTDVFLPVALDTQNSELAGLNLLSFFCAKLREELLKLHLFTEKVSEVFANVEQNISIVTAAVESRINSMADSEDLSDTKEEENNSGGGLFTGVMNLFNTN